MTIYIVLFSSSLLGGFAIIIRNFFRFKHILDNEQKRELAQRNSFFYEFEKYVACPLKAVWQNKFIPVFYKEVEKAAHQFRIYTLKMENKLLKFNNYIKGKRVIKENAIPSEYMQKLNAFKQNEFSRASE